MMLHRHFEQERDRKDLTTSKALRGEEKKQEYVSEIFPPDPEVKEPKRTGRKRKAEE